MARNKMFRVRIPAHRVTHLPNGRYWEVPGGEWEVGAPNEWGARIRCSIWASADAGVPRLRSLIRQTIRASSAEEYVPLSGTKEAKMLAQQAERDRAAGR